MPEIPLGFSFDEDDGGFILRRKDNDGTVTTIKLSAEDLFGLKASIDLWSDRPAIAALVRRDELRSAGPTQVLPGTVTSWLNCPICLQRCGR
jgi:hypothetical protein